MCGIAGLAGTSDREEARRRVALMTSALARRGPDAEGMESWNNATLGHRRLSIFDLSDAGRQPMLAEDGRLAVVFNGAIYNFRELRAELERRGRRFRSNTDTEVLLHGYREWGIDGLLQRILGMFAFGIWDDAEQKLLLARDRLGVKPLIFTERNGTLAFASTTRALRAGGLVDELDPQAVTEFLEYGYVTDHHTIYRHAHKLPAGALLEWRNGRVTTREYWSLPLEHNPRISFEESVEETERLLLKAVERRLFADVPVGALLSGGVDSSLVCWAIAHLGGNVTAFTVGMLGDPWDETPDACETARALGIRHAVLPLSPEVSPGIDELVSAYAEPFACASALGMLGVSRIVKSSATVLLTGDGGDDVFLGYPEHRVLWAAERCARATPAAAAHLWMSLRTHLPRAGALARAAHFLDYVTGGMGAVGSTRDGLPMYQRNRLLGPRLAGARLWQREIPWSLDSARQMLAAFLDSDRRGRFVAEYMTKVDGGTMHYALEARSPFLDQTLWEFAASLPFDIRLHGRRLKAVLRELARRRIGPRVAHGRKRGFGVPVYRWIAGKWRPAVEEAFRDSILDREGWISAPAVLETLGRTAREPEAAQNLWYLFVLENWLKHERRETSDVALETHRLTAHRQF